MKELDDLITEALKEKPERELSLSFTDTLLEKVERRLRWQELLQAFAVKTAIVAGTFIIILVSLLFLSRASENSFLILLKSNWQIITGTGILVLFTFFADQVILKYYTKNRESSF